MKFLAVAIAILLVLILWAQVGETQPSDFKPSGKSPAPVSYELDARTELKVGIRQYAETTYTLYQRTASGKREIWRVLNRDKYAHHWISPNGMVWVVTEGMTGPGGGAIIWARDARGSLKGQWSGNELSRGEPRYKNLVNVGLDADVSATQALTLHNGSEQLRFIDKRGNEFRATLAVTERDEICVSRVFAAGESKKDLLTDLLSKPYSAPSVELSNSGHVSYGVWTFYSEMPKRHLIQMYRADGNFSSTRNMSLVAEHQSASRPSYVDRTPTGKVIWFEFSEPGPSNKATLDIYSFNWKLIKSVDLMALGKYTTSMEAQKSIIYRDVLVNAGGGFEPIQPFKFYSSPVEYWRFSDRTGRKYQVEIKSKDEGQTFEVETITSLNLDQVATKEPTYPGSQLKQEQTAVSADGKFSARLRTYLQQGKQQGQLTLLATVQDPIEGTRTVQLFSVPITYPLTSFRVTNSGRVFALSYPKMPNAQSEMCYLQAWDPSGRTMGLDLTRNPNWFSSTQEAKSKLNLSSAKIELEGLKVERNVEGVPIPNYISEALVFDLGDRTEWLYVGYINDQTPTMFYSQKPKR